MSQVANGSRRGEAAVRSWSVAVAPLDQTSLSAWPSNRERLDGHVFQTREFLALWADTIGRTRQAACHLVTIVDANGVPALYLPLAIERRLGVWVLTFMDGGVVDANAPILGPGLQPSYEEFDEIWRGIVAMLPRVDAIDLAKMPRTIKGRPNPTVAPDAPRHATRGHEVVLEGLDLSAYRAAPERRAHLGMLASRARKMARFGARRLAAPTDTVGKAALFERLAALKRRKYLSTYGYDAFEVFDHLEFYRRALLEGERPLAVIEAELCGEEVAAVVLSFRSPDRSYYVLPAYDDERFGAFSPGARLLADLIDRAAARGEAAFDLGEGDLPYKTLWETTIVALHDRETATSPAGRLMLGARALARHERLAAARSRVKRWMWGRP